MEVPNLFDKNVNMFQNLIKRDGMLGAPICITENTTKPLLLRDLAWNNWQVASKLKVTNTGHTAMLTGQWATAERPSVNCGPFPEPYNLAQIHFHWGCENSVGSEHLLNGQRFPLEMHVMLYRASLKKPKFAYKDPRGLAVLVYFFEVTDAEMKSLEFISQHTKSLKPFKSVTLECKLFNLVKPFTNNYYLYWGSLMSKHCSHIVIWLVQPQTLKINANQLRNFRMMLDKNGSCISKNYGNVSPIQNRNVFHVLSDFSGDFATEFDADCSTSTENDQFVAEIRHYNRFCCLSVKRKSKKCSLQDVMKSLSHLEEEMIGKLDTLEELSKEIIIRDNQERNKLLKTIENQIRKKELKAMLESTNENITNEIFQQLKLRNIFFRTIKNEEFKLQSRTDPEGINIIESNPTVLIRNVRFQDTSESEDEPGYKFENKNERNNWGHEHNDCNFSPPQAADAPSVKNSRMIGDAHPSRKGSKKSKNGNL